MTRYSFLFAGTMLIGFVLASTVSAATVTYTIDPSLSSLTLDVVFGAFTLDGQGAVVDPAAYPLPAADAASKTSRIEGTITADLTGSTLTFSGGSDVDAMTNVNAEFAPFEGTLIPGGGGATYTPGEDNFGFQLDGGGPGAIGHAYLVARDVALDISGGSASFGGPVAAMELGVSDGFAAVTSFGGLAGVAGNGESSLITDPGDEVLNTSGGLLGHTIVGLTETITVPVLLDFDGEVVSGTIVASREIPEPSTFVLFGSALAGLLVLRRRRK